MSRLTGCYESLEGGNTGDAVVDFSGAVAEAIDLEKEAYYKDEEKQDKLFDDLLKVWDRGGIISCSIRVCALCEYLCLCLYTSEKLSSCFYDFIRQVLMRLNSRWRTGW